MGSVTEHQKTEDTSRFSWIQRNSKTDGHGLKVWEKMENLFVFIHPESLWGKMLDESPLHSHSQLWVSTPCYPLDHHSLHTHGQSVREEAYYSCWQLISLSRGVRTSIRWDLFTVHCPVSAELLTEHFVHVQAGFGFRLEAQQDIDSGVSVGKGHKQAVFH